MAAKLVVLISCFAVFNAVNSQVLNVPGLPNALLPQLVGNPLLSNPLIQNQLLLNSPVLPAVSPYLPVVGPNVIGVDLPGYGVDAVFSTPVTVPATTTIIQDSTVANNLANALQLLVVSNLLSNTLPLMGSPDVYVPGYGPVDLVGGPVLPSYPISPCNLPVSPFGYPYLY